MRALFSNRSKLSCFETLPNRAATRYSNIEHLAFTLRCERSSPRRARAVSIIALAATLASSGIAHAHAFLQTAEPAVGSTVTASPGVIRIHFTEGVEPDFTGIVLTNAAGATIPTGKSSVDANDKSLLSVPVTKPLAPGPYKVSWHAVAVDTHRTEGNFMFTIK